MDITVLYTYNEVVNVTPNLRCLWISLAIGAIIGVVMACLIRGGFKKVLSAFLFFTILCTLFQFPWVVQAAGDKTYETRYEVVVGDDVPMNEFNNKYEIVSQRGDILIVRDKQ